jgi:4-diphosphocytidyl-2-C-methyl-D-erythritol kinase
MVTTGQPRELLSPAKINLFLAVTGRRADGYHELATLMACLDLCDRVALRFTGRGIRLSCDTPGIPQNESNLAYHAASLFRFAYRQKTGRWPFEGLHIELGKCIPAGAGLGGGSSNAATVLKALNEEVRDPLSQEELAALALQLGADVPFFLYGRPALATGVGERLAAWPGLRPYAVLIVFPGQGLSTAEVYGALNLRLTKCEKKLRKLLLKRGFFEAAADLCNDLESVATQRCPVITSIKTEFKRLGALGALMSGSGSSVFGLFASADEARRARRQFSARAGWQVFQANLMTH